MNHKIHKALPITSKITIADIGTMGGIPKKWQPLSSYTKFICFEPDAHEFQKLKSTPSTQYLNYALSDKSENLIFYVTKSPGKSSIFTPNTQFLSQFPDSSRFDIIESHIIPAHKVKTLDSFALPTDFIKLDTQGSELKILQGLEETLKQTFGCQIEVEFAEMYQNQPLFHDVDKFMQSHGFVLFDLRRQYWKRKNCNYRGKGQLIFADALYFKNPDFVVNATVEQIYKAVLICLVYGMWDYPMELVKRAQECGKITEKECEKIMKLLKKRSIFKYHWANSDDLIGNVKDL